MVARCKGETGPICPYVTYCQTKDARYEAKRADHQARLIADLDRRNANPNLVALGIDTVGETAPGEFEAYGNMMGTIDEVNDALRENQLRLQGKQFRLLRLFCAAGPLRRRRFGFFGQNILRCSSIVKTRVVAEESFLEAMRNPLPPQPNESA